MRHDCRDAACARPLMQVSWPSLNRSIVKTNKISVGYRVNSKRGVKFRVEEKAAMLLYLVTKNHSFSDGNKRIAATLFLWFLNNNGILYREDGSKRLADNTLVALTLMIAESKTEEKDVMVKVVVNLINQKNE